MVRVRLRWQRHATLEANSSFNAIICGTIISWLQDEDVGTLIATLASLGMTENTVVMYASDNGASNEGNHDYMFFE